MISKVAGSRPGAFTRQLHSKAARQQGISDSYAACVWQRITGHTPLKCVYAIVTVVMHLQQADANMLSLGMHAFRAEKGGS